jgi:serine/threonine protein kinase
MSVHPGSRLGPYEIVSAIGAGGMGEVYKARDTRLDRSVAVKILPGEFASDAQLRIRFEREAKTISQLTHPNICTLYDVGSHEGVEYLVMELLDGESLADRVVRGPMPIEQVLRVGIEVAEALEKAHRAGVVHRDLKPGNVMLTKTGAKLLDFGLAKAAVTPLTSMSAVAGAGTVLPTEHKPLTQEGTIVGTFQYMAPEQIEGRDADTRTDIFALGALLYEMATGKRAFEGKSRASLIASILDREPPPISSVQPIAPRAFERVVQMCLKKEPDDRWQSAHDVAAELRWIAEGDAERSPAARVSRHARIAWPVAALLAIALAAAGAMVVRERNAQRPPIRFAVMPPPNTSWSAFNSLSISPDGRHLVFFATGEEPRGLLFIRNIDSLAAQPLPGTEDASFPFWSPDSKWVGFFTPGKLKKINIAGGPPQTLCDSNGPGGGGTWSTDDVILFAPLPRSRVYRVGAAGGVAAPLLKFDAAAGEKSQDWPQFLPDGEHFLYRSGRQTSDMIVAAALDPSEPRRVVVAADAAFFAPPNHLLFQREGTALAQKFDPRKLMLRGDAVPITEDLGFNPPTGYAAFACSNEGTLLYRGGAVPSFNQLVLIDRSGKVLQKLTPANASVGEPALSPDGRRVAYTAYDPAAKRTDVWVVDLARGTTTRLTFEHGDSANPRWSPDGTRIAYTFQTTAQDGAIMQRLASGAGAPVAITGGKQVALTDWSRDGRFVLFDELGDRRDVVSFEIATGRRMTVAGGPFGQFEGRLSPDGHWFAYVSNESGRPEVFVQAFPPTGGKWQISTAGGIQPVWNRDGKELDYLDFTGKLIAVSIASDDAHFEAGLPAPLFQAPFAGAVDQFGHYDVTRDGEHFIFDPEARAKEPTPITVVLNWTSELPK